MAWKAVAAAAQLLRRLIHVDNGFNVVAFYT